MKHRTLLITLIIILISLLAAPSALAISDYASAANLFQPYVVFSITDDAKAVGVGDFNHDGLKDAAVSTYQGSLMVYLQNAGGGLNSPATYAAGLRPESLAVGDLNHDGWDDIVVTNFSSNTVSVFLQQADGTLASRVTYATNTGPDSVAVGDINNDGFADVVVSHWTAGNIGIFIQNAGGTLNAKVDYTSPQAGYDDIAIGDVNGDGLNDVVKMNGQLYANPDLSVYLQSTGGTLNSAVSYSLPGNILGHGIGIGDVTGDGKLDVVMSYGGNQPNAYVAVFAQAADGALQAPVSYSSYDIPEPIEISDVNLDGLSDVITAHGGWQKASIYPQQGNGTLGVYALYSLPLASSYQPQGLAISDINHDNAPDVLIADYNYGLVVLYHVPVIPAAFNKASPANGAVNQSLAPTLSWTSSTRAASYEYCYDTINDNACDDTWVSTGLNTNANLSSLTSGATYYWQARAVNSFGTTYANGSSTDWRSFTTGNPPAAFNKISPINGSVDQVTGPTISWEASIGATSIEYCYDISNDNACSGSWINAGTGTFANLSGLLGNTTYYWQVRALNGFGMAYANGSGADWWSFTTENKSAPTDISISNAAIPETQPIGTDVGTFTTTDTNVGDVFTYSLVSGAGSTDNASFTIMEGVLKTAAIFNYNTQNSYTIRVRTTDQDGLYFEKTFTVTITDLTNTFGDVPESHWAWQYVERLYRAGVTSGCNQNPLIFCPENPVTRAQMAVFLLRAKYGLTYSPPSVGIATGFDDVPTTYWAAAWIKQLAVEGITSGCGNGNYCPELSVTRDQMAVFLMRAKHGSSYSPPPAIGIFSDVPITHWAAMWIEQLASEGITSGCGASTYCPDNPVTRAQMAVFLVKAFSLP